MDSTVQILVLIADGMDQQDFERIRPLVADSALSAYESAGCLDLVILIGGNTAHSETRVRGAQIAEFINEQCINAGASELPLVIPVPALGDARPIPAEHMLAETLTHRWREIEQRLWTGRQEDVIEGLEQRVFSRYLDWQRAAVAELPGWHPGTLPGEGSIDLAIGSHRLGIVVANSVCRTFGPDRPADQTELSTNQLYNAIGEPWEKWTAANALTLVTTGLPAMLPTELDVRHAVLLLSGHNTHDTSSSKRSAWLHRESMRLSFLQASLRSTEAPEVYDLTTKERERQLPILQRAHLPLVPAESVDDAAIQSSTAILDEFYQQVESGRMLAILVSGLPDDSTTDLDTFKTRLAIDTFGEMPTPEPEMSEVWAAAASRLTPAQLARRIEDLRGDPDTTYPDLYRMLTAPWWRVYDFSASGTIQAIVQNAKTRPIVLIDALSQKPGERTAECEVTTINGSFDGQLNSVDFSTHVGDEASPRALWLNRLKTELLYHPVVVFAASASSGALWQTLSSLNMLHGAHSFPRFLVAPEAGISGKARITHSKLLHIRETPTSFVQRRLMPGTQHLEQGKRRLAESLFARESQAGISLVSNLIDNRTTGSKRFLEGNEPTWGDIVGGFAAPLSVTSRVLYKAFAPDDRGRGIVVLRGRAGSGKTTALMQCAYRLHQQGKVIGWLDRSATNSLQIIRREADALKLDAIILDDVDIFGSRTYSLLRDLSAGGRTVVIGAVRNTKLDFVPSIPDATYVSADEALTEDDLRALIKVLKTRGLLGILKQYMWGPTRLQELRKICDGSLLVAMIRVVTGRLFDEKVHSEFKQLTDAKAFVYATVCLLESAEVFKNRGIDPVDLLQVTSPGPPDPHMNDAIDALVKMRLLVRAPSNIIRCKHRAIADTVIKLLIKEYRPLLGRAVKALLRFYAGYAGDISDSNNPYRRTMVRLLNHALMIELRLPDDTVREVYDSVQEFLDDDFHYWLQRGEFELQRNHLGIAANYFHSARGCGGVGDPFVDTGWASVTLQSSAADPDDSERLAAAVDALRTLDHVCLTRGGASEHSFVVMTRAGTEWLEKVHNVLLQPDLYASCDTVKGIIALARKINLESPQVNKAIREYEPRLTRLIDRTRGVPT